MMFPKRSRTPVLTAALLAAFTGLAAPGEARASSTYPPQAQAALTKQFGKAYCVPQCVLCHQTNVGGLGTLNVFGANLKAKVGLQALEPTNVPDLLAKYFTEDANVDSDGDGMTDVAELQIGASPSIKLPRGEGLVCPDIQYGCGARVAAAPPPSADRVGLICAGLTVLGLALGVSRRRRRS